VRPPHNKRENKSELRLPNLEKSLSIALEHFEKEEENDGNGNTNKETEPVALEGIERKSRPRLVRREKLRTQGIGAPSEVLNPGLDCGAQREEKKRNEREKTVARAPKETDAETEPGLKDIAENRKRQNHPPRDFRQDRQNRPAHRPCKGFHILSHYTHYSFLNLDRA